MFLTNIVEEINHTFYVQQIYSKNVPFMRMWKKYGRFRQGRDVNITQCMRFACWITNATERQS